MSSDTGSYGVLLLGDLHFDGPEYHVREPENEVQKRGRLRNFAMWEGKSQEMLAEAASRLDERFPFVIQAGDLTQGDCDTPELQSAMFRGCFRMLKQTFGGRTVLPVIGNHDLRLLDSEPRWNEYDASGKCLQEIVGEYGPVRDAVIPFITQEAGLEKTPDDPQYAVRHGDDLFIFLDPFRPGGVTDFLRDTLDSAPDARFVFAVTHLTLLPCDPAKGLALWLVPGYEEAAALLARRNAVILAGHTHYHHLVRYRHPEGMLTQLVVSSMSTNWKTGGPLRVWANDYAEYARKMSPYVSVPQLDCFPAENYAEHRTWCCEIDGKRSSTPGYAVLDIGPQGVSAGIYTGGPQPELELKLI
ncbi:MAG: metallophosphoesterase [Lentisphaeria bacterium]|nr:metallophosphoesterase [Lentisphaeria bacterium]